MPCTQQAGVTAQTHGARTECPIALGTRAARDREPPSLQTVQMPSWVTQSLLCVKTCPRGTFGSSKPSQSYLLNGTLWYKTLNATQRVGNGKGTNLRAVFINGKPKEKNKVVGF